MSRYALKPKDDKIFILSEETAEGMVCELLEYYDIDPGRVTEPLQLAAMETNLDGLRDHFRTGKLELKRDEKNRMQVIHNLDGSDPLVYKEVNADAKLATDKTPPEARYAKIYALMGCLCGLGTAGIGKLGVKDRDIVESLGVLFLNA
jgi:hypothetical protein